MVLRNEKHGSRIDAILDIAEEKISEVEDMQ
jgi:hypothetical protein